MQCSTCVWNILMLHVFLWLIRVQTMERFFTITLIVLTSISIEVSRKVEKRSVTSCYHGSTISGWQQNQWRWQWQEERQKIGLYQQTTTFNVQAILYFSLPFLHHYNMKIPNFMSLLYEVGEHNTKIDTFFTLT